MQLLRITYNQACELLSIKRDTLRELILNDPAFPALFKTGSSRQAAVYFDYTDLTHWHNTKKSKGSKQVVKCSSKTSNKRIWPRCAIFK